MQQQLLWTLVKETFPVLLTGGSGLLVAGFALEYVESFEVVHHYPSLVALIPILLGLKCNLEMTLASRLGTAFHLGLIPLDNHQTIVSSKVILANTGVTQIQALVVSALSVLIVELKHWASLDFDLHRALFLLATSIIAAGFTTLSLGFLTTLVLYISTKRSIDPDNVLGPVVASFGDLLAILSLVFVGSLLNGFPNLFLLFLIAGLFTLLPTVFLGFAKRHPKTTRVLYDGWRPLLVGLLIASCTGFLLEDGIESMDGGISLFIPLINGIGGNIGGIYSSRISSALHSKKNVVLSNIGKISPVEAVLSLLPVPTHMVFFSIVLIFFPRARIFSLTFCSLFLVCSVLQVSLLLVMTKYLAQRAWRSGQDPDNHVVPYLTAAADAIGTASLVLISKVV